MQIKLKFYDCFESCVCIKGLAVVVACLEVTDVDNFWSFGKRYVFSVMKFVNNVLIHDQNQTSNVLAKLVLFHSAEGETQFECFSFECF